jgi:hypothetical protein
VAHVDEAEVMHDPLMPLGLGLHTRKNLVHGERDILLDGEPRQQRVVLKHHRAIGSGLVDLAVFEENSSSQNIRKLIYYIDKSIFSTI